MDDDGDPFAVATAAVAASVTNVPAFNFNNDCFVDIDMPTDDFDFLRAQSPGVVSVGALDANEKKRKAEVAVSEPLLGSKKSRGKGKGNKHCKWGEGQCEALAVPGNFGYCKDHHEPKLSKCYICGVAPGTHSKPHGHPMTKLYECVAALYPLPISPWSTRLCASHWGELRTQVTTAPLHILQLLPNLTRTSTTDDEGGR